MTSFEGYYIPYDRSKDKNIYEDIYIIYEEKESEI